MEHLEVSMRDNFEFSLRIKIEIRKENEIIILVEIKREII